MSAEVVDLIDNVDLTTTLLSNPLYWRIRAVEHVTLESGSSCLRSRSLQVAPLRDLVTDVVDVGTAKNAWLVLNVAPMPRGPLLDFDVIGPEGDAFLLPRLEIANREAAFIRHVSQSAGVPVDPLLEALLRSALGFSQAYGLQSTHAEPLRRFLEDGTGQSPPSPVLESIVEVGEQCRRVLQPRADVTVSVNATQQPGLTIPDLLSSGHIENWSDARDLLIRYQEWLVTLSTQANIDEPNLHDDVLNSLADYGAHYDMMVALEVPLDAPFMIKYKERRDLDVAIWTGKATQSLVVADAQSNHVALSVVDPNVRIVSAQALAPDGLPAFGAFAARASQQVYAFYASSEDREYRVDLTFKLAPLFRLQLVPYLVAILLSLLGVGLFSEDLPTLRDAALVVGPAALAASILLAREPSTLGSRLRVASSSAVLAALLFVVVMAAWKYIESA